MIDSVLVSKFATISARYEAERLAAVEGIGGDDHKLGLLSPEAIALSPMGTQHDAQTEHSPPLAPPAVVLEAQHDHEHEAAGLLSSTTV